ncbi:uncharacterized protein LOC130238812 [Danio aesculapii]|uniref:uncharacterized protein LOC130238812 n=1 Tax=Danio aesculapii TaxID=1142201 RepID=UPI0024C01D76|nr:uncharacterized protein LOC130238812 [Danio aesculapii]
MKAMDVINAVQMFMLLWSFTLVCQADPHGCAVSCDNVTGTVGKEVIFTCRVSEQMAKCCVKLYKFFYPEIYNDSDIYRQKPHDKVCEKWSIFTCRYTPDKAMKETFRFFVQACSCADTAEFTVEISEPVKTDAPGNKDLLFQDGNPKTTVAAITAGVSCFIIFIVLTIVIIYKSRQLDVREGCFNSSDRTMTTKKEKIIKKAMFYLQGAPERAALSEL